MDEALLIKKTQKPNTQKTLVKDFRNLGIEQGMNLMVHSSLSSLGWTVEGGVTVIKALQEVLTSSGTLVMPSHTTNNCDPISWQNPSIPIEWVSKVKKSMTGFERDITPPYFMGAIPTLFQKFPSVKRSNHPLYSFLSWGKNSKLITNNHSLDNGLGHDSPLGKLYNLESYILLLGTTYESNTAMHLSENMASHNISVEVSTPIIEGNKTVWKTIKDIEYHEEKFNDIGKEYELYNEISVGRVGNACAKLINFKSIVDFTTNFLKQNK